MKKDLAQSIQDVQSATDITTILQVVESLEKELTAGGNVGYSEDELRKLASAAQARKEVLLAQSDKELAASMRRQALLEQAKSLDPSVVTVEFLQELDGSVVWLRDDYLSMRTLGDKPELVHFLNVVAEVKAKARAEGINFSG